MREHRLPVELRRRLSRPLGHVYTPGEIAGSEFMSLVNQSPMVVTVGDRVTQTLGELGRAPDVQIVDGLENRKQRVPPDVPFKRLVRVVNPAGYITDEAVAGVRDAMAKEKPVRVMVDGEEDLLALLAIMFGPVSAMVFYGQPGEGVVAVKVNAESKSRSREILERTGIVEGG